MPNYTYENDRHAARSRSLVCRPKRLPPRLWAQAARNAVAIEPRNLGRVNRLIRIEPKRPVTPEHLALVTDRKWPVTGVHLTVGFLDNPPAALRTKILANMNAWNRTANVRFSETRVDPQVRIAREGGEEGGYWSYLGTEILEVASDQQTMNLQDFTVNTPESEFHRVVRHETGHTLGFPHEHMRRELVALIDPEKAIRYFGDTQGWSPEEVRQQVLTPLEDAGLIETPHADEHSIMCYQIPGEVTIDGQPILGGLDIDPSDFALAGSVYPKPHSSTMGEATRSVLYEDTAVIEVANGAITRIVLKRPVNPPSDAVTA